MQSVLVAEASCSGRTAFDNGQHRGRCIPASGSTRLARGLKVMNSAKQLSGTQLAGHSLVTTRHRCMTSVRAGADQVRMFSKGERLCVTDRVSILTLVTFYGVCRLSQPFPRQLQRLV